jgi:hypothetical protein
MDLTEVALRVAERVECNGSTCICADRTVA